VDEIVSLIESLSRELQDFREEMRDFRQETRGNFARLEEVTRRHSTAITAGTFSIGGLAKAMERIEALIHDRDQQIADLRDRVRILEEKQGG
jgi:predicted  nucleic acid-binding Zn-ribbon protein